METRKYPLSDEIKELTADALAELALRLEIEAAAYQQTGARNGALLAETRMEAAVRLRRASDYYLSL